MTQEELEIERMFEEWVKYNFPNGVPEATTQEEKDKIPF